jgi:hypothetical protein
MLLVLQSPSAVHVEIDSPNETVFCIDAPLPRLGSRDRELLAVALDALSKGSQIYTPGKIQTITEGRGVRTELLDDQALVTIVVPPSRAIAGADLIASLVREPSFIQEDLDASLARLNDRSKDYWGAAMHPPEFRLKQAPHDDVQSAFDRAFRPDRIAMTFGGAGDAAAIRSEWKTRVEGWSPAREPRYPDYDLIAPLDKNPDVLTTAVLQGETIPAKDPATPARLLGLYALGSGKGSSLFRVCRQRHAWSYRQEAYLWSVGQGWEPRLFVAMIPTPEAESRMQTLRKELLADVDAWTEDDRSRALGVAESTLLRGLPYGPLLLGDAPPDLTPESRIEMAAFWQVKTGTPWDPQALYQSMSSVSLADMKAAAHAILDAAKITIIPPKGA